MGNLASLLSFPAPSNLSSRILRGQHSVVLPLLGFSSVFFFCFFFFLFFFIHLNLARGPRWPLFPSGPPPPQPLACHTRHQGSFSGYSPPPAQSPGTDDKGHPPESLARLRGSLLIVFDRAAECEQHWLAQTYLHSSID